MSRGNTRLAHCALCFSLALACGVEQGSDQPDLGPGGEPESDSEEEPATGSATMTIDCTSIVETGYSGGVGFPIEVITVDGELIERETAAAFIAMREAALNDGIQVRIVSGFRTMAEQEYLYDCYINKDCNEGNLAARPGFSNHQSGSALDLNRRDPGVLDFLRAHADEYGFLETVTGEPWHWDRVGEGKAAEICKPEDEPEDEPETEPETEPEEEDVPPQDECTNPCFPEHPLGAACRADDVYSCEVGANNCTEWVLTQDCGMAAACQGNGDFATCCAGTFCDDDGHWAEPEIEMAAGAGITNGCGTANGHNNFCPDDASDRCEAITMVARATQMPLVGPDAFTDDAGLLCEPFANAAAHHGVTQGTAPGLFSPALPAARTHVAAFIARAWRLPAPGSDHFGDDDGEPVWAQDAHNQLFEAGITMGCDGMTAGKKNFCGGQTVTRAELAVFLSRARTILGVPTW